MSSAESIFVGALLGGITNLLVAQWYHRKASAHLRKETDKLQRLTTMLFESLAAGGVVEVTRDASREINGFKRPLRGTSSPDA